MPNPSAAPLLWFTGLSGAGKTTIAKAALAELRDRGIPAELLDGDEIRAVLSPDLGFSRADRDLQVQRLGYISSLLTRNGVTTLVSAISPYSDSREAALAMNERPRQIFVRASLDTVAARDTKGLYAKALRGEIKGLTGVDDPYEEPNTPHLVIDTDTLGVNESVDAVLALVENETRHA